jgi:flagellin
MALFINTNVTSLNAQRNLNNSTAALAKTYTRLASGLRVNSAADDAAGMAIGSRFTAQIRGLNQSSRNANDAISVLQVAEGALTQTDSSLQRIRELAVQSANDSYTSSDRASLQKEVDQLTSEINRIASQTQFNGQSLLTGNYQGKNFQIGAFSDQIITFSILNASAGGLGGSVQISTQTGAMAAITSIDNAINSVADIRASLGAYQNRFESVIANVNNVSENFSASRSRIMDADIATETSNLTRNSILQQAGTAVLAQANQQPQLALQLLGGR